MHRLQRRTGFTLLELLIVLVVGGLLTSIAIRSFSAVHGSLGTHTALSSYLTMHAQARALAVEQGRPVLLVTDPETGLVSLQTVDGDILRSRNFAGSYDVRIATSAGEVRLCMTPRGYADPRCGNVNAQTTVSFTRGDRTRELTLWPLGQAVEES